MSAECPKSGQGDDGDACGALRSLMGFGEPTSPAEISANPFDTGSLVIQIVQCGRTVGNEAWRGSPWW
jgi:hypothetical protein